MTLKPFFLVPVSNCAGPVCTNSEFNFSATKFIDYNELQYFSFKELFNKNDYEDEEYEPNMKLVNLLFYKNENISETKKNDEYTDFESIFHKKNIEFNEEGLEKDHIYFLIKKRN